MTCNGCQALRGQYFYLQAPVTITATGFSVQELLRVTIPPMADPVELVGRIRPASLATATVVGMNVGLVPAGATTLSGLDAHQWDSFPFTDVADCGWLVELHAWVDKPGDYVLGATKTAGNGQAFANLISKTELWWRR